jgi:hypothetical protein
LLALLLAPILQEGLKGQRYWGEKKPYLFDIKGFANKKPKKEARLCLKQSASTHYLFTPTEK